jgi:hypothetical protein
VFTEDEVGCSDQERFVMELEFIQCLANPFYLNRELCKSLVLYCWTWQQLLLLKQQPHNLQQ